MEEATRTNRISIIGENIIEVIETPIAEKTSRKYCVVALSSGIAALQFFEFPGIFIQVLIIIKYFLILSAMDSVIY